MEPKWRNTTTALLFLAVLLAGVLYLSVGFYQSGFAAGNGFRPVEKTACAVRFHHKSPPLRRGRAAPLTARQLAERAGEATAEAEASIMDVLDRDHLFIETYGLTQSVLGRRVMEDLDPQYTVVRLSDGSLSFANPDAAYMDQTAHGKAVADFRDALEAQLDIPLLYVQAPQKVYLGGEAALPDGLNDYGDAHANLLAYTLRQEDVDYLDLRSVLAETGRYGDLFFRTDHHWTPEGAFLGWQAVAEKLTADYGFQVDSAATDLSRYRSVTYDTVFLGSQGKRVGSLYAGTDEFTALYPSGWTRFSYTVPTQNLERTGRFEQSLLFPERLEETDPYLSNPYTYYSGGDYPFARMKNLQHPDGPTVVLLRDSFACPFAPFMAMGCGELVTIDLRYFHDDLMNYIEWVEADMVVMLYSPGSVKLDAMFDFFYQPDSARPAGRKPLSDVLSLTKPRPGEVADEAGKEASHG